MQNTIQFIFHYLNYLAPSHLPPFVIIGKIALGSIGVFFLIFIVWALFKTSYLSYLILYDAKEFFTFRAFGIKRFTKQWEKILARLDTGNEQEYKLAVVDVDTLIDGAMNQLGFPGANFAERLKRITPVVLPNIAELTEIHAIRDTIVHDPNFVLTLNEARRVMGVYEKTLQNLDLI